MALRISATRSNINRLLDDIDKRYEDIDERRDKVRKLFQDLRTTRGLSFRAAAQRIGCDASDLSKFEKGGIWSLPLIQKALAFYMSEEE